MYFDIKPYVHTLLKSAPKQNVPVEMVINLPTNTRLKYESENQSSVAARQSLAADEIFQFILFSTVLLPIFRRMILAK